MLESIVIKPIRILCIVALIGSITGSLVAQDILWQRVFDTGVSDYSKGIATDSKGNIIVTGRSYRESSGGDFITIKYSSDGDTLWTEWYDTTFYNGVNAITSDCLDNIIIAGYIWTDSTNTDIHIVKYDPNGDLIWTQTYTNGENVGEFCYGVATDSKNNIIVTGTVHYNWGDYITLKYDSNGNLLWKREYDGDWEDYAQDVTVDNSDNIIVTGYSDSDINWDWCTIKYNSDGETLWIRQYDVAETDWAFGVTTDRDENVIVVGETHQLLPGTGGCSAMVVKYSAQGDTLWTKIFTDTLQYAEVVSFADVVTDDYGNIYLAGEYFYWSGTGTSNNRSDYYIVKCDLNGDTLWTFTHDYDNEDEVSGIALDNEGNLVVTGITNHIYGKNKYDFLTIKLKDKGVDKIDEIPLLPDNFVLHQNYPNPFNASTTLRYEIPKAAWVKITLYDLLGRSVGVLVDEYQRPGAYQIAWDAVDFSSGLYLVHMATGSFTSARKLMLVK